LPPFVLPPSSVAPAARQRCATVGAECTAAARWVAPRTAGSDTARRPVRRSRCASTLRH